MILALCLLVSCLPMSAFANEESNVVAQNNGYSTTFIHMGTKTIEIPVLTSSTALISEDETVINSVQTLFVPQSDETGLEKNEQIVNEIKSFGSPVSRNSSVFADAGYMVFTSTLNYTPTYRNGLRYVKIISYQLEREIYTQAPYSTFNKAKAKVVQVGETYLDGYSATDMLAQSTSYTTINYNTLYTAPTDWAPAYGVGNAQNGVHYDVFIDYLASFNADDYYLQYCHPAA